MGLLMLLMAACAGAGTAASPDAVRPDHNLGVGGAPTPGGPDALGEPDGPTLALTAEGATLVVSLDSAGMAVRAVELRLTVEGDARLTLVGPGDALGPAPLAEAIPADGGLTVALARVGDGPTGPVDGSLARVRVGGAGQGVVRVEALALDDALAPLAAIAPVQVTLAP